MSTRWISLAVAVTLVFVAAMGCSGNGSPVAPSPQDDAKIGQSGAGKTVPIGLYQFVVNKNTQEVDIVTLRGAELTLNVLGFMEPPALVNVSIDFDTLDIDADNDYIGVDVIFKHPFITQNNDFMGFDVRGVVFGPQVTNADGYTPLVNPADFFGVPFGYIDGLLGTPDSVGNYDEEYWGFKYFADGLNLNEDLTEWFGDSDNLDDRGKFGEGNNNTRHYDLSWAGSGYPYDFFVFNYAVVANYDWPSGDPPFDLDSFGITTANMAEAFCLTAYEVSNTLYFDGDEGGGDLDIDIEVFDWQGLDDTEVTIESIEAGVIAPVTVTSYDPGTTYRSGIFHFVDVEGTPTTTADLDILITATDKSETFGSSWFFDLLPPGNDFYDEYVYSLQIFTVSVSEGEEPEFEMYWYPVDGQTGNPLSPSPNQGARDSDLGVFNQSQDESRGTTLSQTAGTFNHWSDGYTGSAGTFPWYWGNFYNWLPENFDDVNHFDRTIDGTQVQAISHNQAIFDPGNLDVPNSSACLMLDAGDGSFPDDYVIWLTGFEPSYYWLDFGDCSSAIVGYDGTANGADDNMYFIASYSTRSDNESLHGAWDGGYYFYRWLDPYLQWVDPDLIVYIDGLVIWGLTSQNPNDEGYLIDTEPREHRLGVDDDTGTYFIDPSHPDTDYAEFFYIIDNDNRLHMCVVEFDDPIAFEAIGYVLPDQWEGDIVDAEVAPGYAATELTPYGWSEVLIDKGDNTWTVMTLWWDISEWPDELDVYILHETDPLPGVPLALDVDNDDFELHVLARDGSTIEATVFKWYDNYD